MLDVIERSTHDLMDFNQRTFTEKDRLEYFISLNKEEFTRKDYMEIFKDISGATASRDLKKGVEIKLQKKEIKIKPGINYSGAFAHPLPSTSLREVSKSISKIIAFSKLNKIPLILLIFRR